jgi:Glycosyl transferase family 2
MTATRPAGPLDRSLACAIYYRSILILQPTTTSMIPIDFAATPIMPPDPSGANEPKPLDSSSDKLPDRNSSLHRLPAAMAAIEQLEQTTDLIREASSYQAAPPVLSIIIPAFNEIGTIVQVADAVASLAIRKQIIVVDDGSFDGTREIIQSWMDRDEFLICLHPNNQGKGAAIQTGIQCALGDIVIVQDADLEYDPQDILHVIRPILDGESDVVFGSRYLSNSLQDQSALHRFGNSFLTAFSNWMTNQRLTDMETCYKAFRRELLQKICIEQQRFGFEPEITAKLAKMRIVIREVPIRYKSRSWKEGKKIGFRDLISTLWCIVKYRFTA